MRDAMIATAAEANLPSTSAALNVTDFLRKYGGRSEALRSNYETPVTLKDYVKNLGPPIPFPHELGLEPGKQDAVAWVEQVATNLGVRLEFETLTTPASKCMCPCISSDPVLTKLRSTVYGKVLRISSPYMNSCSWAVEPIFTDPSAARIALCFNAVCLGWFDDVMKAVSNSIGVTRAVEKAVVFEAECIAASLGVPEFRLTYQEHLSKGAYESCLPQYTCHSCSIP